MYKIEYNYDTGDSFTNTPNQTGWLTMEFETYELAKRNANNILEHYKMYQELNSYRSRKSTNEVLDKYKDREWFVNKTRWWLKPETGGWIAIDAKNVEKLRNKGDTVEEDYDSFALERLMYIFLDNGNKIQHSNEWCGYFESLNYIQIVDTKTETIFHT